MGKMFSHEIYGSWRDKQIQKYRDLLKETDFIFEESESVLDIGVGKAWIWEYLEESGYSFESITGVDVSEEATEPEKEYIEYVYTDEFDTGEKFDLVLAFDSVHLIKYANDLYNFVGNNGYLIQSVPMRYKSHLKSFEELKTIREGELGREEKDFYTVQLHRNGIL